MDDTSYKPTINDIKDLRQKTSCGGVACKEALINASGDVENAIQYLRDKYADSFAKRSENKTAEGSFSIHHGKDNHNHDACVVLELLCETSSVADCREFKDLIHELTKLAVAKIEFRKHIINDKENFMQHLINADHHLHDIALKFRENIKIGRVKVFNPSNGLIYNYTHNSGANKIFVAVQLENPINEEIQIAAHICYADPIEINLTDKITHVMAKDRGLKKPEDLALMTQRYFFDQKLAIKDILKDNKCIDFVRYKMGES